MEKTELDVLREAAHDVPMNPVFTDHKGRKTLGLHSMAWASASRAYFAAVDRALATKELDK